MNEPWVNWRLAIPVALVLGALYAAHVGLKNAPCEREEWRTVHSFGGFHGDAPRDIQLRVCK